MLSLCLLILATTSAHIMISSFAAFDADRDNKNSDLLSYPLENLPFKEWWWHGNLDYPPARGVYVELPANGKVDMAFTTNRANTPPEFTGYRGFSYPDNPRGFPEPWETSVFSTLANNTNNRHNTHAPLRNDVGGCVLAIAYKDNQYDVKMEDFVVFSVVHDCVARQLQNFDIPNLPACNTPSGQCLCSWFWIHKSSGGSDQNYMNPFTCKVTNARRDATAIDVANAQPPRMCYNPEHCFFGPRHPMYWYNEFPNMPETHDNNAPFYGIQYGWREGAQHDIFVNTNPYDGRIIPFPREGICSDRNINANGVGSRIASDGRAVLNNGDRLFSPNCQWEFFIQSDGNGILRGAGSNPEGRIVTFTTGSSRTTNSMTVFNDGRLAMVSDTGRTIWEAPMTQGVGARPYRMEVTNEGQLAMFDGYGMIRWSSMFRDRRHWKTAVPTDPDPAVWGRG